uniref:ESF1 RRM domain-containing protein n=1 Tax=Percolomonas cosmopolitus TaxID=63605 RepID=A0A7S1PKC3_9EUKA|eukprot:CAMPEP_0117436488 /NCGR_PEP_ID=MMETSP0759-20121206/1032_1 /TAXON_ID=63605 /ORGANISM="Percolomonas cosmopolitus, Strain WS" /LENGTH=697 /DNA_ID=CAMNT_0005228087 /DNA_START=48 /DNA_END=2141 /DNA_ORIENTATION=-
MNPSTKSNKKSSLKKLSSGKSHSRSKNANSRRSQKKSSSSSSSRNQTNLVDDDRFKHMHVDPKFLPIHSKTKVSDPRMHKLFNREFEMVHSASKNNRDVLKRELLEEMYDFRNDGERMRVEDMMDKMKGDAEASSDDEEMLRTVHSRNFDDDTMRRNLALAQYDDEPESTQKSAEDSAYDFQNETAEQRAIREATERALEEESAQALDIPTLPAGGETCRLSVMNFDWRLIQTPDLFVIFNSFCPEGGSVKKVSILLSKFGEEQMAREEKFGPGNVFLTEEEYEQKMEEKKKFLIEKQKAKEDRLKVRDDYKKKAAKRLERLQQGPGETEMTADFDQNYLDPKKVREYELNRLKYYFGVVECDSVATAIKLYESLDGFEVESTGVLMDIRFIPDHVNFEGRTTLDKPLTKLPKTYQDKKNMMNTNLGATSVKLTWDETDPVRARALKRKDFTDQDFFTLNQFLASESDSDSSSEDEATKRRKRKEKRKQLKRLLKSSKKSSVVHQKAKEPEMEEVEISFDADAEEKAEAFRKAVQDKERLANESKWETTERLRKERKKKEKIERKKKFRQMEAEALEKMAEGPDESMKEQLRELVTNPNDPNEGMKGFNMRRDVDREMTRRKLKKGAQEVEPAFELDVTDSRFADRLLADPEFTLDPTDKRFKRNKNVEKIIQAKEERRKRKRKSKSSSSNKKRKLE